MGLTGVITKEQIIEEACHQTHKINGLKKQVEHQILDSSEAVKWQRDLSSEMKSLFAELGLGSFQNSKVHIVSPPGALLVFGASGFYWPLSGQGQVDRGLANVQLPFTFAHELCHAMGWTDEGECNFLAYLGMIRSSSIWIEYCGQLSYWRYLMAELKPLAPDVYDSLYSELSPAVIEDLVEISNAISRFPEWFPILREKFYDWYLKTNRIEKGIQSYSGLVQWVILYKAKYGLI